MSSSVNEFKLDIAVLTYNHEKYIRQCVESLLNQKTNFSYRIIILDDFSNDKTREELINLKTENPQKIQLIFNEKNLGPLESARILSKEITAPYLCFLDGDDYWIYENKIQKQIDFLENNSDYSGTFHDALILQENISTDTNFNKKTQNQWKTYSQFNRYIDDFMPWALIGRNIIPTASLIFRNINIEAFLEKYTALEFSLSWALHLEIIKNSKFKYFNETWSVYRDHEKGYSKKFSIRDFKLNNIKILENLLNDKSWNYYKYDILKSICSEFRMIIKTENEQNISKKEYSYFLKQYKKYLKKAYLADIQQLKEDYFYVRINRMVE